jgi:hypothetical protein
MSTTSKSPRLVLLSALSVAQESLPAYSHRCSPKVFTQPQLFACLVLKNFLKTDYRGVVAHLKDCPALVETIGLKRIPHFTTLQKSARRLLKSALAKKLLDATVRKQFGRRKRVPKAAIDSTGLECTSASAYFVRRRERVDKPWKTVTYRSFGKLSVICDVDSHFILAFRVGRGPTPDVAELKSMIKDAITRVKVSCLLADAGYDSESNHVFARDEHGIRTIIPPKAGRPTEKPAHGHYRRLMPLYKRKSDSMKRLTGSVPKSRPSCR